MTDLSIEFVDDTRYTNGDIWDALSANNGNMAATARVLGRSRMWISERVARSPELQAHVKSFRDSIIDQAEENIFNRVLAGDDPATEKWLLSTLGKDRGYTQGVSGSGKDGQIEVVIRKLAE